MSSDGGSPSPSSNGVNGSVAPNTNGTNGNGNGNVEVELQETKPAVVTPTPLRSQPSQSQVIIHLDDEDDRKPMRQRTMSVSRSVSIDQHDYHHNQPQPPARPLSPPQPIDAPEVEKEEEAMSDKEKATRQKYAPAISMLDVNHGLSDERVEHQRALFGFNETVEKQMSLWLVFALKFWGATPAMIIVAMVIGFALGHNIEGGVVAGLLVINAIIAFHEDLRARKALAALMAKLQVMARVKRNDDWMEIPARELVPGDLIRLRIGDLAGADVMLLNGHLAVDQSALTGESALKNMKRNGVIFAGSIIKRGEANAVVVATGPNTFFGQTAKLVQSSKPNAHVDRIVNRTVFVLMTLIIILIAATLIVMGVNHDDMVKAIPLLLLVVITGLPVALPAMFTVSMALGSQELSNRSVLVTRLNVLEDAAMMSLLFSDKTGTLTQNHLTVSSILPLMPGASPADVLLTATLCSRKENSDPIDGAILEAYTKCKAQPQSTADAPSAADVTLFPETEEERFEMQHFVPFDANNRRTESVLKLKDGAQHSTSFRVCKGAVATLCGLAGIKVNSDEWNRINATVDEYASKGYRTIAACKAVAGRPLTDGERASIAAMESAGQELSLDQLFPEPRFELVGLIALFDPPRHDSKAIIERLLQLGIQTKMLTGDAMGVACEMGRQLDLGEHFVNLEHEKEVMKTEWAKTAAKEFAIEMPNEDDTPEVASAKAKAAAELEEKLMLSLLDHYDPLKISGFAQIFPSDKHFIVKHTQQKGYVCGMTGDGVNDAPALKQAEVGCAVSNATDVAKGSASAILLADGLSGVVDMVEVGRQIHRRVEVWFINKVTKASLHSIFILVLFLITKDFPVSALQVVLLLLLMDFVLISIATDRQDPGARPGVWNLFQLTRIGLVPGLLGAGQMMALLFGANADYVGTGGFNLTETQRHTFAFEMMFLWGMLAVFSVREKSFFWKSWPSSILLGIVVVESIVVVIVCATGLGHDEFDGIGWSYSFMNLGLALGCFVINDAAKTMWIRYMEPEYASKSAPKHILNQAQDKEQTKGQN